MEKVKVTMFFDVQEVEDVENLKKLEHHVERLLNLDEYPEITAVYDVTVETLS